MTRSFSRSLMTVSALVMFGLGLLLTFAPVELVRRAGLSPGLLLVLAVQAGGALYLGFASLNWMAKDNLIGGIYSRPVAMGNFLHFFVMAMALLRGVPALSWSIPTFAFVAIYLLLALGFGLVLFQHPKPN